MKTTVTYHRADFDGIFCREIARKFLPDAELIGWDYGDSHLEFPKEGTVYVLDLSPECFWESPLRKEWQDRLIWIDHHKTAIEKFPSEIAGYRIDGVAACRLAWQWFSEESIANRTGEAPQLPKKRQFVERIVSEPYAVRLAGEYDIWDKRDPNAELFQHGLRSFDLEEAGAWSALLSTHIGSTEYVDTILDKGKAIQYAKTQENESIIKAAGFTIQFEGFCLLACNAARYNSQLFTAGLKPEHDGMLGFNWDGQQWRVSLYTDKPGIDLSTVAVKYGGGGHRGACGFRCGTLPFSLRNLPDNMS